MSISISQYVKITSGVGGNNNIRARDLILRIFTLSDRVSPDSVLEFSDASGVGDYFGFESEEYSRAVKYFSYISNNIVQPQKISFARDQNSLSKPMLIGQSGNYQVAELKKLSGAVSGSVSGTVFATESVDLAVVTTLADVADKLQSALRKVTGVSVLTDCTVSFDVVETRFIVEGGTNEAVVIKFDASEMVNQLGLNSGEAIQGIAEVKSATESIAIADDISNNYGSFLFMRALILDEIVAVAEQNAAKNVMYMYLERCQKHDAESYSEALMSIPSVGLTLVSNPNTDYDDQIPATLLAATNYNARNGVINYMFKQLPNIAPKVNTTIEAQELDRLRVNYYGRTQTAGQYIDFYQRGVLMGGATAAVDMNIHANEQWLKDACSTSLMTLLMSLSRIPANETGRAMILSILQEPLDQALLNGTISAGKALNVTQKNYITQMTGDNDAWHQVQGCGYWIDAKMESVTTEDGRTEWQCVYTLIYSKDDAIRKIVGSHVMI